MIWDVDSNWLVLAKGNKTAPCFAFIKLDKALSLNLPALELKNVS